MRYLQSGAVVFQLAVGAVVTTLSVLFSCAAPAIPFGMLAFGVGVLSLVDAVAPSRRTLRFRFLRRVVRARRRVVLGLEALEVSARVAAGVLLTPRYAAPLAGVAAVFLLGSVELAATGPWEKAAENLCKAFTGPIGKGLSLVAIAIGGLMFAFGEGGSKSALAGLVFGAGMVLMAPQFLAWLGITGIAC